MLGYQCHVEEIYTKDVAFVKIIAVVVPDCRRCVALLAVPRADATTTTTAAAIPPRNGFCRFHVPLHLRR